MNPDSTIPGSPSIPPGGEWEAQITARLLGELPEEQSKVLDDAMARDPELARLEGRLRQTLGLVQEAVAEPAEPAQGSASLPRMSPGKRDRLLASLRAGTGAVAEAETGLDADEASAGGDASEDIGRRRVIPVEFAGETPVRIPKTGSLWLTLAACLVALLLAATYVVNSVGKPGADVYYASSQRDNGRFGSGTVEADGNFRFLKKTAPEVTSTPSMESLKSLEDAPGDVSGANQRRDDSGINDRAVERGAGLGGSGGGIGGGGAGEASTEAGRVAGSRARTPTVFTRSPVRTTPLEASVGAPPPQPAQGGAVLAFSIDPATGAVIRSDPSGQPTPSAALSSADGVEKLGRRVFVSGMAIHPPTLDKPAAAAADTLGRSQANMPKAGIAPSPGDGREKRDVPSDKDALTDFESKGLPALQPALGVEFVPQIQGAAGRAIGLALSRTNSVRRSALPSEMGTLVARSESRQEREVLAEGRKPSISAQTGTPATPPTPSLRNRYGLANGTVLGDAPTVGQAFNFRAQDMAAVEAKESEASHQTAAGKDPALPESLAGFELQESVEDRVSLDRGASVAATPQGPVPQPEVESAFNNVSTFSLNVSDVSFKLAGASLENGQLPEPSTVRTEEFLNSFQYRDPEPLPGRPVAFAWERAQFPFAQQRDVLRLAVRTGATGREAGRPMNLVLVLDSSGSMERADRVATIREALNVLGNQLKPEDRVSVVNFARTARLWIDGLPGDRASELAARVGELTPEGGTHLEDALRVGYETALKHFTPEGINRLVLLTDGAANLGELRADALRQMVEANRKRGVALDCFGIGFDGYQDELLEALSRNGDGRYGFVNSPEEAATGFVNQLAGALQVAASDVKVQVEFNPERVNVWRQIGYARHQLTQEQFRDNTVDAAELGAAESGNALYVIETHARGNGPIGAVRVRYRDPVSGVYSEHEWAVPYEGPAISLEQASPALRLATVASAFGELLAASPYASEVSNDRLLTLMNGVPDAFSPDPKPERLRQMVQQAQSILGR